MQSIIYFAYGSNLLRERLLARCPSLSFASRAVLAGHQLAFDKASIDKSGKCAFVRAEGENVLGVLWDVPNEDLGELDKHEGVGNGYEQCIVSVAREDGNTVEAVTYRATKHQQGLQPFDWYLALVVAGAVQQQLGQEYIDHLRATSFHIDVDATRKTRHEALGALAMANMMHVFDALAGGNTQAL